MNYLFHPSLARTVIFIGCTIFSIILLSRILQSLIRVPSRFRNKRSQTYVSVLRNMMSAGIYVIGIYIILVILGVNITTLLASAGILGIALGFGARPLIEDLIAGLFLLSQQAIAIGDYVKVADAEGYIENIGFRTLSIRDLSGALSIIPNGQIKSVINYSRHKAHVPVEVTVADTKPIDSLLKTLEIVLNNMKAGKGLEYIVYPESKVSGISDLKGKSVTIKVVLIVSPAFRNQVARNFRYRIKKLAEKKKITLG